MPDAPEPGVITRWEFDIELPAGAVEARIFSSDGKMTRLRFSKETLGKLINALLGVQKRISN